MTTDTLTNETWTVILEANAGRSDLARVPVPWRDLFAPLVLAQAWTIGQLGQSLDGRIATASGHSHYVNGPEALRHLHRLRALADVVVVGIGTVLADDPRLTVRSVGGRSPSRVVIDPRGRLPAHAKVLAADSIRTAIVRSPEVHGHCPPTTERIVLPLGPDGMLDPGAIVDALHARGWRKILVEGGAATVSRFLAARRLDRLHLCVAPLLIGSGPVGLTLPAIDRLDQALRPPVRHARIGEDLLFDVDLSGLQPPHA